MTLTIQQRQEAFQYLLQRLEFGYGYTPDEDRSGSTCVFRNRNIEAYVEMDNIGNFIVSINQISFDPETGDYEHISFITSRAFNFGVAFYSNRLTDRGFYNNALEGIHDVIESAIESINS